MDVDSWIEQLDTDGALLADAAVRAGWDAAVPGTEWDVRALVTHTGGVHRWATDSIRTRATGFGTPADQAIGTGPPDEELLDWFRDGRQALAATLRVMADDAEVFTFLPAPNPRTFWCRRQAHETAIHRADAEAAAGGPVTQFAAGFAQDGLDELVGGFVARRMRPPTEPATIILLADDGPSWQLRLGGERIEFAPWHASGPADALVSGSSSQLYLWAWNRPTDAVISGDPRAAALWGQIQVR